MRCLTRAVLMALVPGSVISAQDSTRKSVACAGQHIDAVTIRSSAPTITGLRKIPVVADIARNFHVTTRPAIIERFLLLHTGDACSELRRAESERILRAQPFLADASVLAYPSDEGGVELEVRTIDEGSLLAGATVTAGAPMVRALRFGSSNVNGAGILLSADWREGLAYRDGYGGKFVDNQFAGRPYILSIEARRKPLGDDWDLQAAHPFLTDLQRIAWRVRGGASGGFVRFEPVDDVVHGLQLDRHYFDVGGIIRIGPPGRLSLFGASISGDDERPATLPMLITAEGLAEDTSSELRDRYEIHRVARINALWGVRDIGFVRVQGFDALTATQDLPVGFQVGAQFGRTLSVLGSRDDDIFMAADLYIGAGGPGGALRVQLQGEGRRDNTRNRWDGILTSGRVVQYVKLTPHHTAVASAEWSGGWRQRIPFLLTLGAAEGGVRGFRDSRVPGGQRIVTRMEDRWFVGTPFKLADAGVALFAEAGRLWAGDVPYGQSTPVRASVGVSLLAAVPPRSARLWRLDLAFPVTSGRGAFELRLSSADRTTFFWREPSEVEVTRERTVPSSIFSWP